MIGTGAAILGASAIGAGASLYGSSKASKAQAQAAQQALAFQQQVHRQNQQNIEPFINAGRSALPSLLDLYGIGSSGKAPFQTAMDNFRVSPDYEFALGEGMKALDRSAASRGNLLGGNQLREITKFGQGLATQNWGNYINRLSSGLQSTASLGQNAATGAGALAANQAGQIGNTMMGIGQAQASGYVGGANAINSGLNNLMFLNAMNRSSYAPVQSGYLPMGFNQGTPGGTGGFLGGFY